MELASPSISGNSDAPPPSTRVTLTIADRDEERAFLDDTNADATATNATATATTAVVAHFLPDADAAFSKQLTPPPLVHRIVTVSHREGSDEGGVIAAFAMRQEPHDAGPKRSKESLTSKLFSSRVLRYV